MRDLIRPVPNSLAEQIATVSDDAREAVRRAKSHATHVAYRQSWEAFERWCAEQGVPSLPASPTILTNYIAAMGKAGKKIATIERALAAVSQFHKLSGHSSPRSHTIVKETMKGLRRMLGVEQDRKVALSPGDMGQILDASHETLRGLRDRALFLVAYFGAFRRSEVVSFTVADVNFRTKYAVFRLRRSKTDQQGQGRDVAIHHYKDDATCAVCVLREWLDRAKIQHGPLFRSIDRYGTVSETALASNSVAWLLKNAATEADLPNVPNISGHSLRAGLVTSAFAGDAPQHLIMNQTGHTSEGMLHRYRRERDLERDNVANYIKFPATRRRS